MSKIKDWIFNNPMVRSMLAEQAEKLEGRVQSLLDKVELKEGEISTALILTKNAEGKLTGFCVTIGGREIEGKTLETLERGIKVNGRDFFNITDMLLGFTQATEQMEKQIDQELQKND